MKALAALLVVAAVLAGCAQSQPPPADTGTDPASEPVAPNLPELQMDAFMGDYESYVTTYPDRADNVETHVAAREAMVAWFEGLNMTVWRHNFTEGIEQSNIVGIQWGVQADEWVMVGAHYDTFHIDCIATDTCAGRKASQGAYDDGSGTAITLHMAKLFAAQRPEYTVAYALFDGEERGLQGSAALAGALEAGETPFGEVHLRAVIDIDMFGLTWPGVNTPVEALHNHPALQAAVEEARLAIGVPDDMIEYGDASASGGSDFASFADKWPTLFFSSNMGTQGMPATPAGKTPTAPGVYPFWHLVDTWETLTASAGGEANLRAGFETANALVARVLFRAAFDPAFEIEPL